MRSLRFRLIIVLAMSLVASAAVSALFVEVVQQSAEARTERAQAVLSHACDLIRDRYGLLVAGWKAPIARTFDAAAKSDLSAAVGIALSREEGVEGGIWQADVGALAYAFPTYEGTGPKTDLPVAEGAQIEAVNQAANREQQALERSTVVGTQTLLLAACPMGGPIAGLTAWTMTRVRTVNGLGPFQLGLGILLVLNIGVAAWLGRTLFVWGRHVRRIEATLAQSNDGDGIPILERTRERELDQIIDALNEAGRKLAQARRHAAGLAARAAQAERLAGLGRVAAGVAHEIRNPIAALQLQGENALAGDDARRFQAIGAMLEQAARLDRLVNELLAMTQRVEPSPELVELPAFLDTVLARHEAVADTRQVMLVSHADPGSGVFDPHVVGRILDNILSNAIRHAKPGGNVRLEAVRGLDSLQLTVIDNGDGVMAEVRDRLFEPFVTSRADGTGLGLFIAHELADAHGGRLALAEIADQDGAVFTLDLPQPRA